MAFAGNGKNETISGKRVLIIVENLPLPFDRRVWLEACALRDAGASVYVICPKMKQYRKTHEVIEGVSIYRHPLPYEASHNALGFLFEYVTALFFELLFSLWIFLRHGFDIIHACNPPDTIFIVGAFYKIFGVRFIFDQHDINPELYIAKYNRKDFFYKLMLFLEKMTYKTANVVISTNQSYRSIAMTRGGKKPEDVFIVRSAPDTDRFHAVDASRCLKHGRDFLIVYLGVMGKQEGIDLLLEAARHLVYDDGIRNIIFALVGDGPQLKKMQALSKSMDLDDFITFTGRIPDDELLEYLSQADICVNPDRVNEMNDKSTMNKIIEYMAVGKPIVQFEMTEGRYSARDASLYARVNDPLDFAAKIKLLLDDPELRETMGKFGLRRLQNELDWKYSKVALYEAYSAALSDREELAKTERAV